MVFQEADLSIRVLRDVLSNEFDGAIIDDPKQYHRVTSFFQRTAPELVPTRRVLLDPSRCSSVGVEEAFQSALSRRVDLPSGGYLIIDYAEALTVIDVNTGSFTGRGKARLWRTRSPGSTSRPPRRPCASCACGTSAGSSSSTSSTWRGRETATRS